jgi:anti-sigma factor RsiW
VNECAEFVEFISAYADIELSDADKKRVEEHLATCVNCSALLEFYREISAAANESSAPAPDSLRSSVMEKVLSEDLPRATNNVVKLKRFRIELARYVPV